MDLKAPRGTHDILPEEVDRWHRMERISRDIFRRFGYREIRTPIVEQIELFERGTGESTDVVSKEMYVIEKKDARYALRPEGTPSVVRAYLQGNLDKTQPFQKFYYIGPMFRYERPQTGRQRQFHQIGVEAIGSDGPLVDAEVIILAAEILGAMEIKGWRLILNSAGCLECRPTYRDLLHKELGPHLGELCEDCKNRYERNVLRILDCKKERCREITRTLPVNERYLCGACTEQFGTVRELLTVAGVPFEADPYLVRGLDYYTRTVFEILHPALGARGAVCGGGRYDNLVEQFGGPRTGCCGFSMGMEAMLAAQGETSEPEALAGPDVCFVAVDEAARRHCFELAIALRRKGRFAEMVYGSNSVKSQMRAAHKMGSRFVAVVGGDEIRTGRLTLKEMATGSESRIDVASIESFLREAAG